jgi:hypothetical protein
MSRELSSYHGHALVLVLHDDESLVELESRSIGSNCTTS